MEEIMVREFHTEGRVIACVPFGSGHINRTWLVVTNTPRLYIMQQVNTQIFRNPDGLMNNILLVTEHLRRKDPAPGRVMALVDTLDGRKYITREDGLWRMYDYVAGGVCLEQAETTEDFMMSGKAFGQFQRDMADFPAEKLTEAIPGFHDTPARFEALRRAAKADTMGRAAQAAAELDFLTAREEYAGMLTRLQRAGTLPLRVTHNDTKLNNVMLDGETHEPKCILDLDTVMPGLAATDFGDAIRFGASTAAEDEPDLSKVHLDLRLYEAFARGFLGACGGSLTEAERETLADGARIMTLELASRFLADYLAGDTYFHIDREGHNLDRARTQIALVKDMEEHDAEIRRMLQSI
ncbi:MAG: aminoglycoside phosphotransferase family protein [Clostridia bacterium]|nr:aminoglycoside phosphotransferase family protein [Clostridia bacterium]